MEPQVNIDFLSGSGQMQGEVASFLNNNDQLNPGMMRPWRSTKTGRSFVTIYKGGDRTKKSNYEQIPIQANATLRRDEWLALDEALLNISRTRLNGIQDLIDNGLTYELGDAMGTTVLEYHDISDAMEAIVTMDGVTRSQGDRPEFTSKYLPIPIIHSDFEINSRVLASSRKLGNPLDTTSVELGSRKVSETLENMLFTNTTKTFAGGTIYSYINAPNRNEVSIVTNWDDSAKTMSQIKNQVLGMKQAAIDAKHYGPYALYIPTAYETVLDDDYDTTTPGTTLRERILKIANINSIKVVDSLPANNVLLVQMTPDVVRLVRGMGIQTVQWQTEGIFVNKYKVMTIQVPQIRADQEGNSGIVQLH